jgi:hypothetical protein
MNSMKTRIKYVVAALLLVTIVGTATAYVTGTGKVIFSQGGNLPAITGPDLLTLDLHCYHVYQDFGQAPVSRVSEVPGNPNGGAGFGWPTDLGIIFDCGLDSASGLRNPALTTMAGRTFFATFTDGARPATALTTPLPSPYTDIGLVSDSLYGRTCRASDLVADLGADTSAGAVTVNLPDGNYNYCIFFDVSTVGPGTALANAFQTFGISWTE